MDATRKANLDRAFNPSLIAVVGDKKISDYMWLKSVRDAKAKVVSVQIDEGEIPGILEMGFENYPSLEAVPGQVDYVIVAVPRPVAPPHRRGTPSRPTPAPRPCLRPDLPRPARRRGYSCRIGSCR